MIMIVTAQDPARGRRRPAATQWIDRSIDEIERHFMKPEFEAVMEAVGPDGEFIDHFDGRMI